MNHPTPSHIGDYDIPRVEVSEARFTKQVRLELVVPVIRRALRMKAKVPYKYLLCVLKRFEIGNRLGAKGQTADFAVVLTVSK